MVLLSNRRRKYTAYAVLVLMINEALVNASTASSAVSGEQDAVVALCAIKPGTLPLDSAGNHVHAHGAGVYVEVSDVSRGG